VLVTNHVLSGAMIGAVVRRPVPAFALGVASHFVLDAVPHWGKFTDRAGFLRAAVPDGLAGLSAIGVVTVVARPEKRLALLAGMAGAALPDLDKPGRLWFGRSPWPDVVNRFHSDIQNESPDRLRRELVTMGAFAVAALLMARSRSRGRAGRRFRPGSAA
jgi:hypothetical protein